MKEKKRFPFSTVLTLALMMALGFGAGWLGAWMADHADLAGWQLLALLAAAAVGVLVQIVLHEGGHLAAGLATGYGFVSFRIGSIMLLKKDGRLQFCRYQLAGTGGQCLLAPPPWREEGFPSLLYNLGGPLANLLSAALCGLGAWLCWQKAPLAAGLWGVWAMLGLYLGLVNGIPLKIQGMPNDGYNALCLRGDKAAQRAIWAQLAINAAQIEGRRLKDLPAEWFELPDNAGPDDPLKGAVWVCRYSRLLDEGRYEDAAALRARLLGSGARLAAVHRYSLEVDQAFFQLTEGQTEAGLAALQEKQLRAFLKQMKSHPGMALVLYGEALAAGKTEEAARRRRALDKMLAAWPYAGDAAAVREMLARTEERLCKSVTEPGTEMCHTESV